MISCVTKCFDFFQAFKHLKNKGLTKANQKQDLSNGLHFFKVYLGKQDTM
jgi:hypothetical protein